MLQSICISYKNNNNYYKSIKYQSGGMLWQHMVTPGAILLLFGGYKMLVFLSVFFFKEIL